MLLMGKSTISMAIFNSKLLDFEHFSTDPVWPRLTGDKSQGLTGRSIVDGGLICFNGVSTIMDLEYSAI